MRGFRRVKVHLFLALLCRVAWGMAVYRKFGDREAVRKAVSVL